MKFFKKLKRFFETKDRIDTFIKTAAPQTMWSYMELEALINGDLYLKRLAINSDYETFLDIMAKCHAAKISPKRYTEVHDRRKA